jgi:hypothetical protein
MNVRFAIAATLIGASLVAVDVLVQGQAPAAPPMQSILAGKKIVPPIKGQADVDYIKSPTRREGTTLVTKIQVRNASNAPIPRLRIAETWYDKSGSMIPGGEGVINGLLQPGEIQTVEIRTPVNASMASQTLMFSHANGPVKPKAVKSLDAPGATPGGKEPATKAAASKKK